MTLVPTIEKPVHLFALQNNGLFIYEKDLLHERVYIWEGKYVTIIQLHWRYSKIKVQATFSKVFIRHAIHFFFQNYVATYWKIFLASLSRTFTCNFTSYIKLPACIRTSSGNVKGILIATYFNTDTVSWIS